MCENITNITGGVSDLENGTCGSDNSTSNVNVFSSGSSKDPSLISSFIWNAGTVAFHIIAFLFIIFPKSVKPSLRIFLVSLSLPGLLQNLSWGLARATNIWLRGPLFSDEDGCTCLLFVTQVSVLSGQTTVAGLAVNNFLAVSYPIVFKRWVTPVKTFICIASVWMFWILFSLIDVFIEVQGKKLCLPMIVSPSYELLTEALVILLTTLVVAVLNVRLIFQLQTQLKIQPLDGGHRVESETATNNGLQMDSAKTGAPTSIFTIAEDDTAFPDKRSSGGKTNRLTVASIHQRLRMWGRRKRRRQIAPEDPVGPDPDSASQSVNESTAMDSSAGTQRNPKARPSGRATRQARVRNTAVTLIVLSIWNSVGYLPFMSCLLVAVATRNQGPSQTLKTLSEAGGLIARLSTIGNTFIYAWRFIKWRSVCAKFCTR